MDEGGSRVDEIMFPTEHSSNKDKALKGHAVQIVEINDENHSFQFNEEALTQIICDDRFKDLPVCIVSVAGKFHGEGGRDMID